MVASIAGSMVAGINHLWYTCVNQTVVVVSRVTNSITMGYPDGKDKRSTPCLPTSA